MCSLKAITRYVMMKISVENKLSLFVPFWFPWSLLQTFKKMEGNKLMKAMEAVMLVLREVSVILKRKYL